MTPVSNLIVMGASLGGIDTLKAIFSNLKKGCHPPIAVVLHRRSAGVGQLSTLFQKQTHLSVSEPDDKTPMAPGQIYIAPADYHLLVNPDHFSLCVGERICYARPSIDVLFDTAALAFPRHLTGVLLTGMGWDGVEGLNKIQARGGTTLVQSPETAVKNEVLLRVLEQMTPDAVLSPAEIARHLNKAALSAPTAEDAHG